ncbi:MAG: ATP-binding protein [Anaerolineae bacterium]|nr:ATP-binding protein [Anaerolineae bacterium]
MSSLTKRTFKIDIPSELGYEKIAIAAVVVVAQKMGFAPERIESLKTAIGEAVTNAIEHGNQLDVEARVLIELVVQPQSLTIEVIDQGQRSIPDLPARRLARDDCRGWGLDWIQKFMDEVTVKATPGCNQISMIAYLNQKS